MNKQKSIVRSMILIAAVISPLAGFVATDSSIEVAPVSICDVPCATEEQTEVAADEVNEKTVQTISCMVQVNSIKTTISEYIKESENTATPKETEPAVTTVPETVVANNATTEQAETTTTTPAVSEVAPVIELPDLKGKCVWVGDSRTVGLSQVMGIDSNQVIAKSGQGYKWLVGQTENITSIEGATVIFNFGVNDLGNINKYIGYFNKLPKDFIENNDVIVMSVNPVDEEKEKNYRYSVKNEHIDAFNEALENGLPDEIIYLDTNSYLKQTGFDTADGVHYTKATYTDIYNCVVQ